MLLFNYVDDNYSSHAPNWYVVAVRIMHVSNRSSYIKDAVVSAVSSMRHVCMSSCITGTSSFMLIAYHPSRSLFHDRPIVIVVDAECKSAF
jgi:hypothetical protein